MIAEVHPVTLHRGVFRRALFSLLWFVLLYVVAAIAVSTIIGGFSGAPTTDFTLAQRAANVANAAFFERYWLFLVIFVGSLTAVLSIRGYLPGTARDTADGARDGAITRD